MIGVPNDRKAIIAHTDNYFEFFAYMNAGDGVCVSNQHHWIFPLQRFGVGRIAAAATVQIIVIVMHAWEF